MTELTINFIIYYQLRILSTTFKSKVFFANDRILIQRQYELNCRTNFALNNNLPAHPNTSNTECERYYDISTLLCSV